MGKGVNPTKCSCLVLVQKILKRICCSKGRATPLFAKRTFVFENNERKLSL